MVYSSTASDCPSYSFASESAKSTKSTAKQRDPEVDLPPYTKENDEDSLHHGRYRAKYSPEFLQDFASLHTSSKGDMQVDGTKYKFVSGAEATDIFNEYIKNSKSNSSSSKAIVRSAHPPIVFAMPTFNSMGRKVLDYYMTYGTDIPKTHALKGNKRRKNFLDHEFNKINQAVTKEYKRMSALIQTGQKSSPAKSPLAQDPVAGPSRLQETADEDIKATIAPPEVENIKESPPTPPAQTEEPALKEERSDSRRRRERSSERRSRRKHRDDDDRKLSKSERVSHDRHDSTGSREHTSHSPSSTEQRPSDGSRPPKDDAHSETKSRRGHSHDRSSRRSERRSEADGASHRERSETRRSRRHRDDHEDDKSHRSERASSRRSRRHRRSSRESRRKDTSDSRDDQHRDTSDSRDSRRKESSDKPTHDREGEPSSRRPSRERRRRDDKRSSKEDSSHAAPQKPHIVVDDAEGSSATLKARRPVLASRGSVMSLPFLQTTSGTPPSHRGGLVVRNPDAPSVIEEDEPVQTAKGTRAEYFDATTSAETLVESENGRGSTTSLSSAVTPSREETPERKNSKFSVKSILKTRRSNVSTIRARPSRGREFVPSEPASDAESDPEMMVVLLDEKSGKNPWKQLQKHFKVEKGPSHRPSKTRLFSSSWFQSKSRSDLTSSPCTSDTEDYCSDSSESSCSSCDSEDDDDNDDPVFPHHNPLGYPTKLLRSQSARAGWPGADGQSPVIPVRWAASSNASEASGVGPSYPPASYVPIQVHGSPYHSDGANVAIVDATGGGMPTNYDVSQYAASPNVWVHAASLQSTPISMASATLLSPQSHYSHLHPQSFGHRPASQSELDEYARNSPYNQSSRQMGSSVHSSSPWGSQTPLSPAASVSSPHSAHSQFPTQWGIPNTPVWRYTGVNGQTYSYPSTPGRSATY